MSSRFERRNARTEGRWDGRRDERKDEQMDRRANGGTDGEKEVWALVLALPHLLLFLLRPLRWDSLSELRVFLGKISRRGEALCFVSPFQSVFNELRAKQMTKIYFIVLPNPVVNFTPELVGVREGFRR